MQDGEAFMMQFMEQIYLEIFLILLPMIKKEEENVIEYAKTYLDRTFPILDKKWENVDKIFIENNKLIIKGDGIEIKLSNEEQYVGYRILENQKYEVILIKNNLLY